MNSEEIEEEGASLNDSEEVLRDDDPDIKEENEDGVGLWALSSYKWRR